MLEKLAQSPYLNLLSGLVLLISSGYETWDTLEHFSLGAHHGVLLFSIVQIMKSLLEMMDGAEKMVEAKSAA